MKYLLAIDSFKGCLSSAEAEDAAAAGIRQAEPEAEVVMLPVSDGGEGMLEAWLSAWGGRKVEMKAHDAMMRPTEVEYGIHGDTALIESANVIGLSAIPEELRNPLVATSYGLGEVVTHAVLQGCTTLIIGLGGSATSDCGLGMLKAVKDLLGSWDRVGKCKLILACDVDNPLYGERGAAAVFGPQKGATPDMMRKLDRRARTFAAASARHFGRDKACCPGAGAAGGLGYAFMEFWGAEMEKGTELLFRRVGLDRLLEGTNLVITGEGKADRQTLMGKLPSGILCHAARFGIPTMLIAGQVEDREALFRAGFVRVEEINPVGASSEDALRPEVAKARIASTVARLCRNPG